MKISKLAICSFTSALATLIYIMGVAFLMSSGEEIFGKMNNYWGPVFFLLLFVFSALITGILILGKPIWFYLKGDKKDSIKILLLTMLWLFIFIVLFFVGNILI